MQSDRSGKPERRSRQDNDVCKFRNRACKGRQESIAGGGRCAGQHGGEPGDCGAGRAGCDIGEYHGESHQ